MTDRVLLYKGPGAISFHGRAGRREWLIGFGVNTLIGTVIGALSTIGPLLSLPWMVAVLAVTSRRLHDMGRPGWLQLVPMGLFALALGLYAVVDPAGFAALRDGGDLSWPLDPVLGATAAVVCAGYLVFYLWVGSTNGDPGPNCYGEVD